MRILPYFSFIQPQTVGHHRYTAEGHGQGGQNGVQLTQHDRQGLESANYRNYRDVHKLINNIQKQPNKISMIFWRSKYVLSSYQIDGA